MVRLLVLLGIVLLAASACTVERTWYEERCVRAGLVPGTDAFQECAARELRYLAENRRIMRANAGR